MKKYKLRCPSKEEKEFMIDIFKKYHYSECSAFKVTEWSNHYDETPSEYCMNVKAEGLKYGDGKSYPKDNGVFYKISKKKLNKWIKDNKIKKPKFDEATYIE